jgi:NADPH2:quinone reductase
MAELIAPQGAIVALVSQRGPLDLNLLKDKSVRFCWEFMFTRSRFRTPDRHRQGEILDRLAERLEAGTLRPALRRTLGPISAANLELAHREVASGRMIGKLALEGWG